MALEDDYATLRVQMRPGSTTLDAIARAAELLEALGGLLAEDPEVGGVETRDPTTLDGPERPEIVVYTVPAAASRVAAEAARLAADLDLDVLIHGETHHGDAWRDRWKEFFPARVLGAESLLLRPSWLERRPGDPACEVVIDPGRAFGTGLHETTGLCLDLLVALYEAGVQFERVLDLGCGSGILALAAARLFPRARVIAVDLDPEATATTAENVTLNRLEDRIETITGTVDEVPRAAHDLVLANIRCDVLVRAAEAILARAGRDLLLSGILAEEGDRVEGAYTRLGARTVARPRRGDWVGLHLRREAGR